MANESGTQSVGHPSWAFDPSNYFVQGKITAVEGQELIINDDQHVVKRVAITNATRFWMGRVGAPVSQVKPGDFLYARGSLSGTTLVGVRVWVNIVSLPGVITRVEKERFFIKNRDEDVAIEIQPETEHFVGGTLQSRSAARIAQGTPVQVIGLWDESAQRVRATRLFLPPEPGSPRPPKPT